MDLVDSLELTDEETHTHQYHTLHRKQKCMSHRQNFDSGSTREANVSFIQLIKYSYFE